MWLSGLSRISRSRGDARREVWCFLCVGCLRKRGGFIHRRGGRNTRTIVFCDFRRCYSRIFISIIHISVLTIRTHRPTPAVMYNAPSTPGYYRTFPERSIRKKCCINVPSKFRSSEPLPPLFPFPSSKWDIRDIGFESPLWKMHQAHIQS